MNEEETARHHDAAIVRIGGLIGELVEAVNALTLVALSERPCLREAQQMMGYLGNLDGLCADAARKFYRRWPAGVPGSAT